MSGDTKPSDNLVKFSQGVDVLIHEVGRSKQDPALIGPPNELLQNSRQTRGQAKTIADHHTDGTEAGRVFERVKPGYAALEDCVRLGAAAGLEADSADLLRMLMLVVVRSCLSEGQRRDEKKRVHRQNLPRRQYHSAWLAVSF
jgi:hypothetical protein